MTMSRDNYYDLPNDDNDEYDDTGDEYTVCDVCGSLDAYQCAYSVVKCWFDDPDSPIVIGVVSVYCPDCKKQFDYREGQPLSDCHCEDD